MFTQKATVSAAETIGTVTQVYDGMLTSDIQVNTFRHIDRLFPVRVVKHGSNVLELPRAAKPLTKVQFSSGGKTYDLIDYLALNRVTALLVLKDGKIAYEDYEMGNTEQTRWMSMSIAKSITSSLIGAALQDGHIKDIDDPVTNYVPKLEGSAYDGVSIRYLLQMASGVKWDETYTNPAVVRSAVGRSLAEYLSDRIWSKAGMESDATWWLDSPDGAEIGGSGLSAVLRDYGRFGLFLMNGGVAGGEKILPDGWIRDAGSSKTIGGKVVDYGYMIWPFAARPGSANQGAFQALGIYGQHIYVNPRERVVIVVWGALPKPSGMEVIADQDFFAAATEALR